MIAQLEDHCPEAYISQGKLSSEGVSWFQQLVYTKFKELQRTFPWRETINPYYITVSEIMLQQTQTHRVIPKYLEFITSFPTFEALALASQRDVLAAWSGLGYNRRALALQKISQAVIANYSASLPANIDLLRAFPCIGPNTAASICAFAFNMPTIFIETNIRTVFIHTFFNSTKIVHDADIMPLITQTRDLQQARIWYYALMDYGVYLKSKHRFINKRSSSYHTQSRFIGSNREIRGTIIKLLTQNHSLSLEEFIHITRFEKEKLNHCLQHLYKEQLISFDTTVQSYHL